MRSYTVAGVILCMIDLAAFVNAAPPQGKAAQAPPKAVDADKLPPGQFIGTIVSPPDGERMFTLKITYPEVRLKPGARMPNLRNAQVQNMNRNYQQMIRLQQQFNRSAHHHAIHNMMQMQQAFLQTQMAQQRAMQSLARIEQQEVQQELRLLQQEIRAIQNMYQVVKVSRDVIFQSDENVKVRTKNLPEIFDEKGRIRKYTREELAALKGKDRNLVGYESSAEALKPGQVVLVTLRAHRATKPAKHEQTIVHKEKDDKEKDEDAGASIQHKMQVRVIVILKDIDSSPPAASPTNKQKKK